MKITGIKSWLCDAYRINMAFIKVETDEGVCGYGEASMGQFEYAVEGMVKDLSWKITGRDPRDVESIWHDLNRDAYWRGGPVLSSALAGIEMACWDIKGKLLGEPVWQLLGGKCRDAVPCYANGWFAGAKAPGEFAAMARSAVASGFKSLKWPPFWNQYRDISTEGLEGVVQCVAAVREAVGGSIGLMVECHGRFNFESALRIARRLEEFNILWLEEPLLPELQFSMHELRRKVNIPLGSRRTHLQQVPGYGINKAGVLRFYPAGYLPCRD